MSLLELVLPAACAGCGAQSRSAVCASCAAVVSAAVPGPAVPSPAPVGFPPCTALGRYDGPLRGLILAYKEEGRHDLARPLGRLLGAVVASAMWPGGPVVLVAVPATAGAARARYGDHIARLCRHAQLALRAAGWPAGRCQPLRAVAKPDSTGLDAPARARAAQAAFRVRGRGAAALRRAAAAGARVVVVDDIVTTGATLAAVSQLLATVGIAVDAAAVLAATQRRFAPQ